jgi:hypothetical protein
MDSNKSQELFVRLPAAGREYWNNGIEERIGLLLFNIPQSAIYNPQSRRGVI